MINRQSAIENRKLKAFTLIELLVVIAIISLLVSILLPSLNRAKDLARRAVCTSNLHSISLTYVLYANEYDGCVPVGHCGNPKQFNYTVFSGVGNPEEDPSGFIIFGSLYRTNLLANIEVLYCPSLKWADNEFATPSNPWPAEEGSLTRSGYGAKPEGHWTSTAPSSLPRIFDLASKAVVADLLMHADYIPATHKTGVNAGYMDGSAKWVDITPLQDDLNQLGWPWSDVYNGMVDNIWDILDEQR